MKTKKKAAGLDALAHIADDIKTPVTNTQQPINDIPAKKTKSFPLHLPLEVHKVLREVAFHEETSMTKLILEGVDSLFKERGLKTIEELKDK